MNEKLSKFLCKLRYSKALLYGENLNTRLLRKHLRNRKLSPLSDDRAQSYQEQKAKEGF